ncbi:MAG: hypothetical protein VW621_06440, partial [Betaproteobacteria bacterium]
LFSRSSILSNTAYAGNETVIRRSERSVLAKKKPPFGGLLQSSKKKINGLQCTLLLRNRISFLCILGLST